MRIRPVVFKWTGEAMEPLDKFKSTCDRQFVIGAEYSLAPEEERNMAMHGAIMAQFTEGFRNLPETISARFPTATHLRRWLLIEAGYFDEKEFDCDSEKNARKLGTWIRTEDEYARISIHGRKVIVRRAKSQAVRNMAPKEFKESSEAALALLEEMISVPRGTLKREAGRSA